MTGEQYGKANKAVFPVLMMVTGYIVLTMIFAILNSFSQGEGVPLRLFVQFFAAGIGMIGCIFFFVTKKQEKTGAYGMLIFATATYLTIRLVGKLADSWVYALPILLCAMIYLNRKIILIGVVLSILSNIGHLLLNLNSMDGDAGATTFVSIFFSCVLVYAADFVTRLLVRFNEENLNAITEAAKQQEASSEKMTQVAENIIEHFGNAMEMLDHLQVNLDENNECMKCIADSTEMTTRSVQTQTEMCSEIGNQTDEAERVSADMT